METVHIRLLTENDPIPWDLLLDADPEKSLVEKYIKTGEVYVTEMDGEIIGVYVLDDIGNNTIELKNIAVNIKHQGKKIGKKMVLDAIERTKEKGAKKIEVGTGNSGLSQLALYQKCGFRITGIIPNFFTDHYAEPIYENGIQCVDMVRLTLPLG